MINRMVKVVEIALTPSGAYLARVLFDGPDGYEESQYFKFQQDPTQDEIKLAAQNYLIRQLTQPLAIPQPLPPDAVPLRQLTWTGKVALWLIRILQRWVR